MSGSCLFVRRPDVSVIGEEVTIVSPYIVSHENIVVTVRNTYLTFLVSYGSESFFLEWLSNGNCERNCIKKAH